jgi:hypothetical protein
LCRETPVIVRNPPGKFRTRGYSLVPPAQPVASHYTQYSQLEHIATGFGHTRDNMVVIPENPPCLHPGLFDLPTATNAQYHLVDSIAKTDSKQLENLRRRRSSSPAVKFSMKECTMPAMPNKPTRNATDIAKLTYMAYQTYQSARHLIKTTSFNGQLGTFHDNGDGSNRVTEEDVRKAILRDVYGGKDDEFNEHVRRMCDHQDFGDFVDRLEKANCYELLEDRLPGSKLVTPVVRLENLKIQMTLYRLILHLAAPGMCEYRLLPDENTVIGTLVPGLYRDGDAIHLYWTEPGPAGLLMDTGDHLSDSEASRKLFNGHHVLVLTNGLCFRPISGQPLNFDDCGRKTVRCSDGTGESRYLNFGAADFVLACMLRLTPLELRELKANPASGERLTGDHVTVDHHRHAPDHLRLANFVDQATNVILNRDNGDATGRMDWMGLDEMVEYLWSIRSCPDAAVPFLARILSTIYRRYIVDKDIIIDYIKGSLCDEKRWVQAGAAKHGWTSDELRKLRGELTGELGTQRLSKDLIEELDEELLEESLTDVNARSCKVPILLVQNLEIHVDLGCARKKVGESHMFAMSEHCSWHDRNRYPTIAVTFQDGHTRHVMFHSLLTTTTAMNFDTFGILGAAHGMLLGNEWDPKKPGVVPFDLAFCVEDGQTYWRPLVKTKEDGWQVIEVDHIGGNPRYARYTRIEMVTAAQNMRRARGYFLDVTMSFGPGQDGRIETLSKATLGEFHEWAARYLGITSSDVKTWWDSKTWVSKSDSGPRTENDVSPSKKGDTFETAIFKQQVELVLTVDGTATMHVEPGKGMENPVLYNGDLSSVLKSGDGFFKRQLWMLVRFCEEHPPVATTLSGRQGCLDFIYEQLQDDTQRLDPARTTDVLLEKMRRSTSRDRWVSHMCFRERYVFRPLSHLPDKELHGHVPSDLLRDAVLATDKVEKDAYIAEIRRYYDDDDDHHDACEGTMADLNKLLEDPQEAASIDRKNGLKCGIREFLARNLSRKEIQPGTERRDFHMTTCTRCFAYAVVHTLGKENVGKLWNMGVSSFQKEQIQKLLSALAGIQGTLETMLSANASEDELLKAMKDVTEPLCPVLDDSVPADCEDTRHKLELLASPEAGEPLSQGSMIKLRQAFWYFLGISTMKKGSRHLQQCDQCFALAVVHTLGDTPPWITRQSTDEQKEAIKALRYIRDKHRPHEDNMDALIEEIHQQFPRDRTSQSPEGTSDAPKRKRE